MSATVYEEVVLAEMTYDDSEQMYYYECPCGDKFEISLEDLYDGEDIAPCPSCTLQIKVIFKEARILTALIVQSHFFIVVFSCWWCGVHGRRVPHMTVGDN